MKKLLFLYSVIVLTASIAANGMQKVGRQISRYGASNYRPVPAAAYNAYKAAQGAALDRGASNPAANYALNQLRSNSNNNVRPMGVGAFSFGMASGRQPTYGASNFAVNTKPQAAQISGAYSSNYQGSPVHVRSPANPLYRTSAPSLPAGVRPLNIHYN